MYKKTNGLFLNNMMNNILKKSKDAVADNIYNAQIEYNGMLPKTQIEKLINKNNDIGLTDKYCYRNKKTLPVNENSYEVRQNLITEANIDDLNTNQNEE